VKQRIRVAAIIRRGEEVLLLKRSSGRSEEVPKWELPTGKILFGEQPEEAMGRIVFDSVGVRLSVVKITDAITFTDLYGASQLGNLYIVFGVELSESGVTEGRYGSSALAAGGASSNVVKITTDRYTAYKWAKGREMAGMNLDEATIAVLEITGARGKKDVVENNYRGTANAATVYVDGGSRGNPGPSGVGYYILAADGSVLKRGGEFIGFNTSRVAEYYALKEGIEQALELRLRTVRFVSDSLMVVNQMTGLYKVKNKDLWQVHEDVVRLLGGFEAYSFVHVGREQNREADTEVNRAIEEHMAQKGWGRRR
jgi:ribonuclease HI/ADP-ribose pyrophosphatase YjhB (NUDIX family)